MRQLPIEHRAHAVGADDQVAVAEVAVHQPRRCRRFGQVIAQPAKGQFEHRAAAAEGLVERRELVEFGRGEPRFQRRQIRCRHGMNARGNGAALKGEPRTDAGESGVAQDAARQRFPRDPLRQKTAAEIVLRRQDVMDGGNRHAASAGAADELRLSLRIDGHVARHRIGGKPAQDQRRRGGLADGREGPGFLVGASGQTDERAVLQLAAAETNKECVEFLGQRGGGIDPIAHRPSLTAIGAIR